VVGDADFTPNPDRAIWVEGPLNEALLERLRHEILELTRQNREPITVFINSRGGSPEVGRALLNLLRRTTQEDARRSRIITVAAPKARSMAANLLSAGDFAIAYPESALLYHGARWSLPCEELTGEWAKIAQTLPTFHEMNAAALAHSSVRRFLAIVSAERPLFEQHRAYNGTGALTDLGCFQAILGGKLSPAAQKVLEMAVPLSDSYNGLLVHFQKKLRTGRTVTKEQLQRLMIYASIDFESQTRGGAPAWDGGLSRIGDHFYFLNAYFDFGELSERLAAREAFQTTGRDARADYFLQFRVFFLALCRALQEGENCITPSDAVWLGLIDTVRTDESPRRGGS
jgi:ATP-dependent protease ClpP protease subunit